MNEVMFYESLRAAVVALEGIESYISENTPNEVDNVVEPSKKARAIISDILFEREGGCTLMEADLVYLLTYCEGITVCYPDFMPAYNRFKKAFAGIITNY